jgi:hypothetical protein
MNECASGENGFSPLVRAPRDDCIRAHGLRDGGVFICIGIHYVAAEESLRDGGLASRLWLAVMATGREKGMRSATLRASVALPVWEHRLS